MEAAGRRLIRNNEQPISFEVILVSSLNLIGTSNGRGEIVLTSYAFGQSHIAGALLHTLRRTAPLDGRNIVSPCQWFVVSCSWS